MGLISELKRRNVFKVAAAYLVTAWLAIQVIEVSVDLMGLPQWIGKTLVLILVVGFPFTVIMAWAYELTPDGLKKDRDRPQSEIRNTLFSRRFQVLTLVTLGIVTVIFIIDIGLSTHGLPSKNEITSDALPKRTVAVLPFVDMSPGSDQARIGDIIAIEMQTELSKRSDFLVLSSTATNTAIKGNLAPQVAAQAMDVDMLVEGTVRVVGDRIRVTAQLVSVGDGFQLWSDVFEATVKDDFSAEVAVAEFFSLNVRKELTGAFDRNIQLTDLSDTDSGFEGAFGEPNLIPASISSLNTPKANADDQ